MKANYILTRFENTPNGEVNYSWKPEKQDQYVIRKLITWNWKWLREEAAKLEVGESKIYEMDV